MCGRFVLQTPCDYLERLFAVNADHDSIGELQPRWNIPPTEQIPAVAIGRDGQRSLDLYRWGLIPSWVTDLSAFKATTFNARAEAIATKPTFRSSFFTKRLLIPADGFYEWRKNGDKQPYLFRRVDGEQLVFAGLWDIWKHPGGELMRSCTIVTIEANSDMSEVHDRMPLVIERDSWERWLDPELQDKEELEAMLHAGPEGTMSHYAVNRSVGSIKNDHPELLNSL